jgi:hypothetical protein
VADDNNVVINLATGLLWEWIGDGSATVFSY